MAKRFLVFLGLLVAGAAALSPCLAAESNPPGPAADYSVTRLLASAQNSIAALESAEDELSRDIACRAAVVSLTGLYQLHGCKWAWPMLAKVAMSPDCPEMYYGISADGRMSVTVDRLDLRNPIFEGYAIYLCTFENITAEVLEHDITSQRCLSFRLPGEVVLNAEELTPDHPLWGQLSRLADTFIPPEAMYPGGGYGFKQIISLPAGNDMRAESVVIEWGDYAIEIQVFQRYEDD